MADTPNLITERIDRRISDWIGTPSTYFVVGDPIKGFCTRLGNTYELNPDKGGAVPGAKTVDPVSAANNGGIATSDWILITLVNKIVDVANEIKGSAAELALLEAAYPLATTPIMTEIEIRNSDTSQGTYIGMSRHYILRLTERWDVPTGAYVREWKESGAQT